MTWLLAAMSLGYGELSLKTLVPLGFLDVHPPKHRTSYLDPSPYEYIQPPLFHSIPLGKCLFFFIDCSNLQLTTINHSNPILINQQGVFALARIVVAYKCFNQNPATKYAYIYIYPYYVHANDHQLSTISDNIP